MKSRRKTRGMLTCIVVMLATCMALPLPAMATDTASATAAFSMRAERMLQDTLSRISQEENLNARFSDVHLSVSEDTVREYHGDADAYVKDIISLYRRDGQDAPSAPQNNMRAASTRRYTSSVFSGVPAGGVCHVKQDFEATVSNYRVTRKRLLGSSYQTGVCLFQWSPNYSWFEGNLNVNSKGTFHAIVKGSGVSFSATFMAIFHTNRDSLWQEFQ